MNAHKPALITTFITQPKHAMPLIRHLARLSSAGGLGLQAHGDTDAWYNEKEKTIAEQVWHPDLPDVELVQVVLNGNGTASAGWLEETQTLEQALEGLAEETKSAILGRTLIYQAALEPQNEQNEQNQPNQADADSHHTPDELDELVVELLNSLHLQSSADERRFIRRFQAADNVSGGRLWLLQSAHNGTENLYLALGNDATQEALIYDVLLGQEAILLWPDSVAHKAYAMIDQYQMSGGHDRFSAASDRLMKQAHHILKQTTSKPTNELTLQTQNALDLYNQPDWLARLEEEALAIEQLSTEIATITTVSAELTRLHSRITIHHHNYNISVRSWPSESAIMSYHRNQLTNALYRLQEDLNEANAALKAADSAFNRLRIQHERQRSAQQERKNQREARDNNRTQFILALIALIISVGQVIDQNIMLTLARFAAIVLVLFIAWLVWPYVRRKMEEER